MSGWGCCLGALMECGSVVNVKNGIVFREMYLEYADLGEENWVQSRLYGYIAWGYDDPEDHHQVPGESGKLRIKIGKFKDLCELISRSTHKPHSLVMHSIEQ